MGTGEQGFSAGILRSSCCGMGNTAGELRTSCKPEPFPKPSSWQRSHPTPAVSTAEPREHTWKEHSRSSSSSPCHQQWLLLLSQSGPWGWLGAVLLPAQPGMLPARLQPCQPPFLQGPGSELWSSCQFLPRAGRWAASVAENEYLNHLPSSCTSLGWERHPACPFLLSIPFCSTVRQAEQWGWLFGGGRGK